MAYTLNTRIQYTHHNYVLHIVYGVVMETTISLQTVYEMNTAFIRFRKRMVTSNRAYLRDIAQVIDGRNLSPKRAMGKMINALPTVGYMIKDFDSPQTAAEAIPDTDLDGVSDFQPVSSEKRERFLALLSQKVNGYIQERGGDNEQTLCLPEAYMALLCHCDAVQDPDLRVIDVGGLHGTWCIWPEDEKAAFELDVGVEEAIKHCAVVEPHSGWEFKTAFMIDRSDKTFCTYGYCRWRKDFTLAPDKTEQDYEWKWRIFYDGVHQSETNRVFDDLVEYLDWLSGWYDREVHNDLTVATRQIDNPPFLEGVSDVYEGDSYEGDSGDGTGYLLSTGFDKLAL